MSQSNFVSPQEPDWSGWEAYRARVDEEGRLQKPFHVVAWWDKHPELPRSPILKEAHQGLVDAGADSDFAAKVLTVLTESSQHYYAQAILASRLPSALLGDRDQSIQQLKKVEAMYLALKRLKEDPGFANFASFNRPFYIVVTNLVATN